MSGMRGMARWAAVVGIGVAVSAYSAGPARACCGDCNSDGRVLIPELIDGVQIALGTAPLPVCASFDANGDQQVTIDELLLAVKAALAGCPAPVINTIAGTGEAGRNADGLPPLATELYLPQDMTYGPDNLLYILDWNNHRIARIRNGAVETFAGSGYLGDATGDDPKTIDFNHPTNLTFDHDGNMLVAAWHNSLIKKIIVNPDDSAGTVSTVAGTGGRSFGGDGGPATAAILNLPSSVVVDSIGNIFVSDQANQRIREVDTTAQHIISTIAGTGTAGSMGDGGPATMAQINGPSGQAAAPASRIAIDARNRIYIADTSNHKIRLINEVGEISTIVGTGTAGYSGDGGPATAAQLNTPSDVAITPNGILYIADTYNNVVRLVQPGPDGIPNGTIDTFAGTGTAGFAGDGGPAKAAELDRPYGVETAPNGDVYIADTYNHRIRVVSGLEQTPAPTPEPSPTPVIIPCTGVVGSICTYAGNGQTGFSGDGQDRLQSTLYWPFDIEFTASHRKVFLDWNNHKVREILPDDTITTIMGTAFVGDGPTDLSDNQPQGADPLTVNLNHPTAVKEFSNGDLLVVCWHNHKLRVLDKSDDRVHVLLGAAAGFAGDKGPLLQSGTGKALALVNQPPRGVFDPDGNFFFIDQRNQRIRVIYKFDQQRSSAIIDTVVGNGTAGFNGDNAALSTELSFPTGGNPEPASGITRGPDGAIYFSDTNNNRIRKVVFSDPGVFLNGVVTTIAGTGDQGYKGDGGPAVNAQLNYPEDIEFGPDGNLYFADTNNNVVRMIDLKTQIITTIAGTGQNGYSGDGGPAVAAQLNRPFGVAFDEKGDLYISDTFNSRIRVVKR